MGLYLGHAVTQNPKGDLLGHVYDHGRALRRYRRARLRDQRPPALPHRLGRRRGPALPAPFQERRPVERGERRHHPQRDPEAQPEYLAPLYRGFHYIRREAALTESPVTPYRLPVFGVRDGKVSVRLIRNQINAACTKTGVPLAPIERAALDLFDELAQDPGIHLDMDLQVGDIQFCNNYVMLHSRTSFEDYPEVERRRHMIRLWLTMDERRPLAEGFPPQNGYGDRQLIETALQATG